MLVVMMPMPAFPVDVCRIRPAVVAVFGYAQTMLRTLLLHLVLMHKRKKPCKDIAQRQQYMVDSGRHCFCVYGIVWQWNRYATKDQTFFSLLM